MAQSNFQQPEKPKGGWTHTDNVIRCNHCPSTPPIVTIPINLKRGGNLPSVPLAKIEKCIKCDWVLKRYVIKGFYVNLSEDKKEFVPPATETHGITIDMIRRCMDNAPKYYDFTEEEFKTGIITGAKDAPRSLPDFVYNPDKFTESVKDDVEEVPF